MKNYIILDNNLVCDFLSKIEEPNFASLRTLIFGTGKAYLTLVTGGGLRREYEGHKRYRNTFLELSRAGRLKQFSDSAVDAETLKHRDHIKSDDPHVIALAVISGTRVLCSLDDLLTEDFIDPSIINNPRGKVWKRASHDHLIKKAAKFSPAYTNAKS